MKIKKMERNIQFESSPDGFGVLIGGKIFTRFIARTSLPKPIFYPLFTPSGIAVTRSVPEVDGGPAVTDHPHHRGLWTGHGSVNGCDFWEEYKSDHGNIKVEYVSYKSEKTMGHIHMTAIWEDGTGEKILREQRRCDIFGLPDANIMDFNIALTPAEDRAVTFGDTKEGGLVAVRIAPWMVAEKTGRIFNAEALSYSGRTGGPEVTWGKRASWCACCGQTKAEASATVAIIHRPGGFRFPTWWHVRAYGLFTANPFGQSFFESDATPPLSGDFTIRSGESLATSYRIIVADGELSSQRIMEIQQI